ncbi:hypothetical protein PUV54_08635 [Hyphococcus flavus]|uniref:Uncharacterized protein n=1 Tax=Hyphococcus flavus TaxID=1866326 RepID=A0AAE9Z9T2_9PROT|nr:hypothetical protein [Hyphococcus flavus]WDI30023.1 hypothetical protein PUV54_08635 [Hyphococcus flavus]
MLALFLAPSGSNASPWARPDGELLIISRGEYFSTHLDPIETPQGIIDARFDRFESNTYLEYGLTKDITIGGKALYGTSWLRRGIETDAASGFSEIEAFAQYQLLRDARHAASVRISAGKPARFLSGARTFLQGNGIDVEIAALYGRDLVLEPVKIFSAIETGYRKRFSNSADQIKSQATIGIEPIDNLLFLFEGFSTFSLRNEINDGTDYDIVKLQPSLVYQISNHWSLQAGVTEEISGRNLELGRTYFIGFWSKF